VLPSARIGGNRVPRHANPHAAPHALTMMPSMSDQVTAAAASEISAAPPAPRGIRRVLRRPLARVAIVLLVIYGVWCAGMLGLETNLLFPRQFAGEPHRAVPPGAEQVWIRAVDDGSRVEALYFQAPGAAAAPAPVVIYAHGNGELIGQQMHIVEMYRSMGMNVLLAEYRGYGNCEGTPSQRAIVSDFEQFHSWLLRRPEIDPDRFIYHGRSLGGGVAAQLAASRRPAALILETTFTSITSFAWRYGVPPFLVRSPFRTDRVLPTLRGMPILIMHGRRDTIVPVSHGRRLRDPAPWADYYETDDDHNDFPTDARAYRETIRAFLVKHGFVGE